jgi:mono/diheme cytochrome c family protein
VIPSEFQAGSLIVPAETSMRRKIGWTLGLVLIAGLLVGITATIGWRPFIGPESRPLTARRFAPTPVRLARGEYLTENLLSCFACHSDRDWTRHDAPEIAGTKGGGSPAFPLQDLPGRVHPPNISPAQQTGAGNWTDDQLARAIRDGIGNDGRALFPFMPYENFRHLSDEDLASVIVYLRSIPAVDRAVPRTELEFPVKYLIRAAPKPVNEPVPAPDLSSAVRRGDYLVTVGGCRDCHTVQKNGQRLAALDLAGGFLLRGPWGEVASANLTPDPSGIPYYDEALFVEVMRTGYAKARKISQIMPWWNYRNLTDDDLKDIFAYLRSVSPVKHRVDNSTGATLCNACGMKHGLGDQN